MPEKLTGRGARPLVGVPVATATGGRFAGAVTDDKGEFTFAPLPAGEYMIRVAHQGHLELRMKIEAKPDQEKPLDIRLRTNIGAQRCVASRYHTPDCP